MAKRKKLVPLVSKYRPNVANHVGWKSSLPYFTSDKHKVIHRVRSAGSYMYGGELSHHYVGFWCGNGTTTKHGDYFMSNPPKNKLICERCEGLAVAAGQLTSKQLIGEHRHTGTAKHGQSCCKQDKTMDTEQKNVLTQETWRDGNTRLEISQVRELPPAQDMQLTLRVDWPQLALLPKAEVDDLRSTIIKAGEDLADKISAKYEKFYRVIENERHAEFLVGLFSQAGLPPVFYRIEEGSMLDDTPSERFRPWVRAATARGDIRLGVVDNHYIIDWRFSLITQEPREIFTDENLCYTNYRLYRAKSSAEVLAVLRRLSEIPSRKCYS